MRKWFCALALVFGLSVAVKADDDFVPLFNGKDLTSWKLHPETNTGAFKEVKAVMADGKKVAWEGITKDGKTITLWKVVDGAIAGGGPMSHLYHDAAKWENFHFRAEVKINDKGNSGIFFRAGYRGGIPEGYEAQIDATHSDPIRTGSIYPNGEFGLNKFRKDIVVMNTAPHKPDEFFTYEIIAKGATLTTIVNGKKIKEWTDPAKTFTKGHFALQGHDPGSVMTFKKIEVKELK